MRNNHQTHELAYWADTIAKQGGWEKWLEYRKGGLKYRLHEFPELWGETGKGLDVITRLMSKFRLKRSKSRRGEDNKRDLYFAKYVKQNNN